MTTNDTHSISHDRSLNPSPNGNNAKGFLPKIDSVNTTPRGRYGK